MESVHQPLQADFKLLKRKKKAGKTNRIYEKKPQTPYERLLASARSAGKKMRWREGWRAMQVLLMQRRVRPRSPNRPR